MINPWTEAWRIVEIWVIQSVNDEDHEHNSPRTQYKLHDRDTAFEAYRTMKGRRKLFRVTVEDMGARTDEPFAGDLNDD